jgi:CBS domain-containing membrane protein
MQVRDLMTRKVFTVRADKKLIIVDEIMSWARVRHVPVVDAQDRLVGLISHRDLMRASISSVETRVAQEERRQHEWTIPVREVMHARVHTIGPEESVQEAAKRMRSGKIGCFPVVSEGKLIGIITEHDLLRLVEQM